MKNIFIKDYVKDYFKEKMYFFLDWIEYRG